MSQSFRKISFLFFGLSSLEEILTYNAFEIIRVLENFVFQMFTAHIQYAFCGTKNLDTLLSYLRLYLYAAFVVMMGIHALKYQLSMQINLHWQYLKSKNALSNLKELVRLINPFLFKPDKFIFYSDLWYFEHCNIWGCIIMSHLWCHLLDVLVSYVGGWRVLAWRYGLKIWTDVRSRIKLLVVRDVWTDCFRENFFSHVCFTMTIWKE